MRRTEQNWYVQTEFQGQVAVECLDAGRGYETKVTRERKENGVDSVVRTGKRREGDEEMVSERKNKRHECSRVSGE